MNPSKPLMALGAALVLAAPCVVRAAADDADWKPINTASQAYFVHKADFAKYAKMEKQLFGGPIALWVEEKQEGDPAPKKVESGATLNCHKTLHKIHGKTSATWDCHVIANAKNGGRYEVLVQVGPKQFHVPPATRQASDARPADVSQDVWAAVVNSGKVPQAQWERAARDIEQALKSPQAAKMHAGGTRGLNALIAAVSADIAAGKDDGKIVEHAIDLGEKTAVPRKAGAGAAPATVAGAATANGQEGPDGGTIDADGTNVLNTLAKALENPDVQGDMAKQFTAFLKKPTGPDAYVDAQGHEEAAAAQLDKGIAAGIQKICADQAGRGRAAVLYFMLGEDAPKPWFQGHPELDAMVRPQVMRQYFREAMKIWTVGGVKTPGVANAGPYKGDAAWPESIITDALDRAEKTWKDPRVKGKIKESVDQNEQGVAVPGGIGKNAGKILDGTTVGFGEDSTWTRGGVVKMVRKADGTYRKLIFKVVSQQTDYGPPPVVEDRVQILDISQPASSVHDVSNFFGRTYRIGSQFMPKDPIALDGSDAGAQKYSMSLKDGSFTVAATDKKGHDVGDGVTVSLSEIYSARRQMLNDPHDSYATSINGQNFRVIPQPGNHNSLAFFPADDSGRATGDSAALTVDLTELGPDGRGRPIRDGGKIADRPLGYVGKSEDGKSDQFYKLQWNPDTKTYDIVTGEKPDSPPWDQLAVAKKSDATGSNPASGGDASTDTAAGAPSAGGGSSGGGDAPTAGDPGSAKDTDVFACQYDKTFKLQPSFELYRVQNKFKMYTDGTGASNGGNSTYLCVYNTMGLLVNGLIPSAENAVQIIGDGKSDGSYLDVTSVVSGADDKGQNLIIPKDATNLKVDGKRRDKLVYGKGDQRDLSQSVEYMIPIKGLFDSMKKSGNIAVTAKVAWVERTIVYDTGNQNPQVTVYIRPDDDVKAVLTKAIVDYGGDSTLCKSGGQPTKAVADYIDSVAADEDLKKELAKADLADANLHLPNVTFSCLAQQTGQREWDLAKTSWDLSTTILRVKDGKVDETSGYAQK